MRTLSGQLDGSIPIILLLLEGRPRLLEGVADLSNAVVMGYLPGPMGGQAIADIISGEVSPSGRLPFTYPKDPGSIPYPYHRKPSSMCTDPNNVYSNVECEVKYPLRLYFFNYVCLIFSFFVAVWGTDRVELWNRNFVLQF